uniref:F-box domain-containing protein n=1 Tax=Chromera velia CCMP2878 TaxID=1169474 RepID=A0A0G4HQE1_9ALVE|eukprot:Cvel_30245.t1-p1 / transcript=Cvel_30245.t1 / gene=Cvel_30245 / organism=Chromera_velia_CCMP2878 / gene_product=hypothetical protein / transcript_product=hypothetical protein / location=Cvel_scaffold4287:2799-6767(+) / protein_length=628 / sequence_SO=supercontig / SO=protein_coding / is_pseudo=false
MSEFFFEAPESLTTSLWSFLSFQELCRRREVCKEFCRSLTSAVSSASFSSQEMDRIFSAISSLEGTQSTKTTGHSSVPFSPFQCVKSLKVVLFSPHISGDVRLPPFLSLLGDALRSLFLTIRPERSLDLQSTARGLWLPADALCDFLQKVNGSLENLDLALSSRAGFLVRERVCLDFVLQQKESSSEERGHQGQASDCHSSVKFLETVSSLTIRGATRKSLKLRGARCPHLRSLRLAFIEVNEHDHPLGGILSSCQNSLEELCFFCEEGDDEAFHLAQALAEGLQEVMKGGSPSHCSAVAAASSSSSRPMSGLGSAPVPPPVLQHSSETQAFPSEREETSGVEGDAWGDVGLGDKRPRGEGKNVARPDEETGEKEGVTQEGQTEMEVDTSPTTVRQGAQKQSVERRHFYVLPKLQYLQLGSLSVPLLRRLGEASPPSLHTLSILQGDFIRFDRGIDFLADATAPLPSLEVVRFRHRQPGERLQRLEDAIEDRRGELRNVAWGAKSCDLRGEGLEKFEDRGPGTAAIFPLASSSYSASAQCAVGVSSSVPVPPSFSSSSSVSFQSASGFPAKSAVCSFPSSLFEAFRLEQERGKSGGSSIKFSKENPSRFPHVRVFSVNPVEEHSLFLD